MTTQRNYYNPDDAGWEWAKEIVPYREKDDKREPHVFEIGLVMAGAISAGCYSAGVLDFLIEALDEWEKAKGNGNAPKHRVRIRVMAGASAGGMNAAIAANVLNYDFPHFRPGSSAAALANPFYDAWVKKISIDKLLEVNDIQQTVVVASLLDCSILQTITDSALDYSAAKINRPYLDSRVRFIFTQSSLRGTPYYCGFTGNAGSGMGMTLHKTWHSFSINYQGITPVLRRPDDTPLDPSIGEKSTIAGWAALGNAALGSGAFPLALMPRLETRNPQTMKWRFVVTAEPGNSAPKIVQLLPNWKTDPASWPEYIADGGIMDNEPLDLAHMEMNGINYNSPRDGKCAFRALIMVDPFPQTPDLIPEEPPKPFTLIDSLKGIVTAAREQLRFNPEDVALAIDESVYSRYLIAPVCSEDGKVLKENDKAIASGSLGGFGGFLEESYRHHDYMLGRRNCQQFLRASFTLPAENSLFYSDDNNVPAGKDGEFPIIPLCGRMALEEPLPAWPTKPADLASLRNKIDVRAEAVVSTFFKTNKPKDWFFWALMKLAGYRWVRMKAINKVIEKVNDGLKAWGLPVKPE